MSRTGKKHKTWNQDQMKLAIRAVREKEMGCLKASKVFDVPKSTLEDYVKQFDKTSKVFDVPKSTLEDYVKQFDKTPDQLVAAPIGRRPVLSLEMEEDLVSYCLEMDRRFYGLGTADIKRLAYEIAFKNGLRHPFSQKKFKNGLRHPFSQKNEAAGKKWLKGFFKRHPVLALRNRTASQKLESKALLQKMLIHFLTFWNQQWKELIIIPQDCTTSTKVA
ncbi:CENP-B N-terminal DNA-binding domain [Popillia japonica]|uniref:CENP-B N-terminal DNA-binding domain n=1 Tax=Popillia japonica TaxID=7064 RepID=A0AAW1L7Z9_POPJA